MSDSPLSEYSATGRDTLAAIATLGGAADARTVDCPRLSAVVAEVQSSRGSAGSVTQQAIYSRLRKLDDAGLLTRSPNPADGRGSLYRLTDAGAGVLDRQAEYYRHATNGGCALSLDERVRRDLHAVAADPTKATVSASGVASRLGVSSGAVSKAIPRVVDQDHRLALQRVNRDGGGRGGRWEVERR